MSTQSRSRVSLLICCAVAGIWLSGVIMTWWMCFWQAATAALTDMMAFPVTLLQPGERPAAGGDPMAISVPITAGAGIRASTFLIGLSSITDGLAGKAGGYDAGSCAHVAIQDSEVQQRSQIPSRSLHLRTTEPLSAARCRIW